METRGFVGFVVDETAKITYNRWDSYPEGLGAKVAEFVHQLGADDAVKSAADRARQLKVVTNAVLPTDEQIAALAPWTDTGVGNRADRPDWYQVLRRTQGDPDAILSAGYIEDASDFPLDSLYAEWGYLIDFDAQQVEVYKGFQSDGPKAGRWAGKDDTGSAGYGAVGLVATVPFADLGRQSPAAVLTLAIPGYQE